MYVQFLLKIRQIRQIFKTFWKMCVLQCTVMCHTLFLLNGWRSKPSGWLTCRLTPCTASLSTGTMRKSNGNRFPLLTAHPKPTLTWGFNLNSFKIYSYNVANKYEMECELVFDFLLWRKCTNHVSVKIKMWDDLSTSALGKHGKCTYWIIYVHSWCLVVYKPLFFMTIQTTGPLSRECDCLLLGCITHQWDACMWSRSRGIIYKVFHWQSRPEDPIKLLQY